MKEAISRSLQIRGITALESMSEAHFFNSSSFLLDKPFDVKGWQLVREGMPVAQVFFYIENGVAISGYQSTFGSFDVEKDVSEEEFSWFLDFLINKLKNQGVIRIKIKHYPSYFKSSKFVEDGLNRSDFENTLTETNQHINIDKPRFEDIANRSEVIRSNKCDTFGYLFKTSSITQLPRIYSLIEDTLKRNGNRPSMSYSGLKSILEVCPNNYKLFSLWDGEKLIAATVSVIISNSIMYNFYHADHLEYRKVSSLTYLLKNIYTYCYKNNFKVLDLGISSVNGIINKGLFNFKKTRGAIMSDKNYYNLTL